MSPGPVRLMQHRVHEKFIDSRKAINVNIHHLVVYLNAQSNLRGMSLAGINAYTSVRATKLPPEANVHGYAISLEEFEEIDEEYKRALNSVANNPRYGSFFVTYLDAEINGERKFIQSITPVNLSTENETHPQVFAVEEAVKYFLSQY